MGETFGTGGGAERVLCDVRLDSEFESESESAAGAGAGSSA